MLFSHHYGQEVLRPTLSVREGPRSDCKYTLKRDEPPLSWPLNHFPSVHDPQLDGKTGLRWQLIVTIARSRHK